MIGADPFSKRVRKMLSPICPGLTWTTDIMQTVNPLLNERTDEWENSEAGSPLKKNKRIIAMNWIYNVLFCTQSTYIEPIIDSHHKHTGGGKLHVSP